MTFCPTAMTFAFSKHWKDWSSPPFPPVTSEPCPPHKMSTKKCIRHRLQKTPFNPTEELLLLLLWLLLWLLWLLLWLWLWLWLLLLLLLLFLCRLESSFQQGVLPVFQPPWDARLGARKCGVLPQLVPWNFKQLRKPVQDVGGLKNYQPNWTQPPQNTHFDTFSWNFLLNMVATPIEVRKFNDRFITFLFDDELVIYLYNI